MKIHDLIDHFSTYTSVPVDPNDVAKQIKLAGIRDVISFVEVELEVRVLRGALHTYVMPTGVYGEPDICSDIFYARQQPRAWKRLVCIKELLHILDNSVSQTATPEDFEILVDGLCVNPQSWGASIQEIQVWGDRLMVFYATAIIFPERSRELFRGCKPPDGRTLESYVAEKLDIPENVAGMVLSDHWENILKAIRGTK